MGTATNDQNFKFLDQTLNLLLIEDNPEFKDFIGELFEPVTIYKLHTASTCAEALSLLRSGLRFHTCIMDLGMNDVENDEFFILRQYSNHCSIIVLTGSSSPNKGATCIKLGARAVLEKGATFDSRALFNLVNDNVILNVINHRYSENSPDTLNFATKILLERKPQTVTEWADYMRITDRQLRNLWQTGAGFSAKYVLFVYDMLSCALDYYRVKLFGSAEERENLDCSSEEKLFSYFTSHKEIITFLLS